MVFQSEAEPEPPTYSLPHVALWCLIMMSHRPFRFFIVNLSPFAQSVLVFGLQNESTSDMIFSIPQLVSFISQFMTFEPGDVVLTGTPAGPAPLHAGDLVECGLEGVLQIEFHVKASIV